MARYDVIIAGGEVLDPANNRQEIADIGISGGKVTEVAPELDRSDAGEVIDAKASPDDIAATLYEALGIPHDTVRYD